MPSTYQKQNWFGVKKAHVAFMTSETTPAWDTPVAVPGLVSVKFDAELSDDKLYADDEVWTADDIDNGFTGEMEFRDLESTEELREMFAKMVGYQLDSNGRILGTSSHPATPFAFMCENGGRVAKKRRCMLKCIASKPGAEWKTNEDGKEYVTYTLSFKAVPVTITTTTGTGTSAVTVEWRGAFYDDFSGSQTFDTFFSAVDDELAPASS